MQIAYVSQVLRVSDSSKIRYAKVCSDGLTQHLANNYSTVQRCPSLQMSFPHLEID